MDNLKNYESIKNISNINIKNIMKEINKFLNENNIYEKLRYLLKEYDKIPKNSLIIEYYNNSNLKIFGKHFVEKNKENCYLIINGKKYNIQEYCPLKVN